jgi:hypothetical protein
MPTFLMRSLVMALGVALLAVSPASAQCTYPHGQQSALNGWTRMMQAFVPCGGLDCDGTAGAPIANNTTAGGMPSCSPPQTYHQMAGSPAGGWRFDPFTGRARFRLDAQPGPNVRIRVQVADIRDANSPADAPVGRTASAYMIFRFTFNDAGTDMTVIDFPLSVPLPITSTSGDGSFDTTMNALLAAIGQPPLAPCTNVELLEITVLDPNSNKFLRPGHFRF